jgi:hypothetical protein
MTSHRSNCLNSFFYSDSNFSKQIFLFVEVIRKKNQGKERKILLALNYTKIVWCLLSRVCPVSKLAECGLDVSGFSSSKLRNFCFHNSALLDFLINLFLSSSAVSFHSVCPDKFFCNKFPFCLSRQVLLQLVSTVSVQTSFLQLVSTLSDQTSSSAISFHAVCPDKFSAISFHSVCPDKFSAISFYSVCTD